MNKDKEWLHEIDPNHEILLHGGKWSEEAKQRVREARKAGRKVADMFASFYRNSGVQRTVNNVGKEVSRSATYAANSALSAVARRTAASRFKQVRTISKGVSKYAQNNIKRTSNSALARYSKSASHTANKVSKSVNKFVKKQKGPAKRFTKQAGKAASDVAKKTKKTISDGVKTAKKTVKDVVTYKDRKYKERVNKVKKQVAGIKGLSEKDRANLTRELILDSDPKNRRNAKDLYNEANIKERLNSKLNKNGSENYISDDDLNKLARSINDAESPRMKRRKKAREKLEKSGLLNQSGFVSGDNYQAILPKLRK